MKIRTNRTAMAGLESVAITDIILNMFIFFFTSFSLVYTFNPNRESRIQVKLPQADVKAPAKQKEPIEVTIDARSRVYLGGKSIHCRGSHFWVAVRAYMVLAQGINHDHN